MKRVYMVLLLCFVGLPCVLAQQTQQGAADDTDNLVKQTQNPVASLISVPFQKDNLGRRPCAFDSYGDLLGTRHKKMGRRTCDCGSCAAEGGLSGRSRTISGPLRETTIHG
jgi:hypothetical protein